MAAVGRTAPPLPRLGLAPHVTASRVARDFVSRTCLDWGLAPAIASACLVVSELVTNGLRHAVTDMDLTLARHGGILRLALRDRSDAPLRPQAPDLHSVGGRGLALVPPAPEPGASCRPRTAARSSGRSLMSDRRFSSNRWSQSV